MMATHLRKKSNEWLRELLKDKYFGVVVNLGCGLDNNQEGDFYSNYFKWDKMIKIDIKKVKGVDIVAPAEDLPLDDNSIDFIFSNWMLNYLTKENRIKAVSEIRRVLKLKGKILVSYWDLKEAKFMRYLLMKNFQVLDSWKLDYKNGRADIIYGVKNET